MKSTSVVQLQTNRLACLDWDLLSSGFFPLWNMYGRLLGDSRRSVFIKRYGKENTLQEMIYLNALSQNLSKYETIQAPFLSYCTRSFGKNQRFMNKSAKRLV